MRLLSPFGVLMRFHLNTLYGFVASEIAAILGLTPDAAKKRLSRAKQRLRAAYLAQNPQAPGAALHEHE